jgi:hypothetical protein
MHNLKDKVIPVLFLLAALLGACKKEKQVSFGVVKDAVYEDKARKNKSKSDAEYISILYTNLYQVPISPTQLYKTQNILYSIGDRNVASELVLSNYFNTGGLKIPSNTSMRSNIDSFVQNSYKRFFLRYPSEGERTFFRNYITMNPNVTVEMVYTAFSVSDEYQYY